MVVVVPAGPALVLAGIGGSALPGLGSAELIGGTMSSVGAIVHIDFHARVLGFDLELAGRLRGVEEDHVLERERGLPPADGEHVERPPAGRTGT